MIALRCGRVLKKNRCIISASHLLTSSDGGTPSYQTQTPPMLQDTRHHTAPMFSIVRNNSSTSKDEIEKSEPTLELARAMQTGIKTMDNSSLVLLASMDSPPHEEARAEVLKRHIMRYVSEMTQQKFGLPHHSFIFFHCSVDSVDYPTAEATFKTIEAANREGLSFLFAPHKIGLGVAGIAAVSSYFLCFDLTLGEENVLFLGFDTNLSTQLIVFFTYYIR